MKVFDKAEDGGWGSKVNFVDDNDVFVGYDMNECCCEHFGWFIADEILKELPESENRDTPLDEWSFDTCFFQQTAYGKHEFDEDNMAVFKITNGTEVKYLHLYNCHNGYYNHGFEMKINDEIMHKGDL